MAVRGAACNRTHSTTVAASVCATSRRLALRRVLELLYRHRLHAIQRDPRSHSGHGSCARRPRIDVGRPPRTVL